jgi:hypothetical protein
VWGGLTFAYVVDLRVMWEVRDSVQRLFDTFKLIKTSLLSTHSYHKRIHNSTSLKVIAAPLPSGFCVTPEICPLLGTLLTALTLRP